VPTDKVSTQSRHGHRSKYHVRRAAQCIKW